MLSFLRARIAMGDSVYKGVVGAGEAHDDAFNRFAGHAYVGAFGSKREDEHERCRLRLLRRFLPCFELRQLDLWRLCLGEARVGGNGVGKVAGDANGYAQLLRCDGRVGAAVTGG